MTRVVSVDLAARRTRDVGVAVLEVSRGSIDCEFARGLEAAIGPIPDANALADWLVRRSADRIAIDGPQAWKDETNGLVHQRVCERALATQAKTGPPGCVKPGTQRRFVELSIALFDALAQRGFPRFDPARPDASSAVEVFPTACWRALGAPRLPAKRRCAATELSRCTELLERDFGVRFSAPPGHDELQAAVGGLALTESHWRAFGVPPYEVDGSWREGVIVVPEPANSSR